MIDALTEQYQIVRNLEEKRDTITEKLGQTSDYFEILVLERELRYNTTFLQFAKEELQNLESRK